VKSLRHELSRREFLSAAAIATSMFAIGLNSDLGLALADRATKGRRRIGISDEAYAAARSRAAALTAKMTVSEKVAQLNDRADAIPRLDIPAYNYYSNEALHGLCTGPQATSFPVPLALAASWNPDLFLKVYEAVADECRAHDNAEHGGLSFYSPVTLNLHRDPRWGRCYEAPGEDPCLAATIAVQVVRGMQGDDPNFLKTTACSKHFICNNTDNDRESISATVDDRSFWEFYTRAYRETIFQGDVFTFMSAYSALNGIPCSADHELLTDILRDLWGFRGYVTSDCDAIKDIYDPHHYAPDAPTAASMAIKAGCDLDCWGEGYSKNLQAAYDRGLVTEDQIGESVTSLLTVRVLLGTLDAPEKVPYSSITMTSLPWKDHADLAVESARQSLVLLKNENNFLPLDPSKINRLAVIGPLGDICHLGEYSGDPAIQISPLKGIVNRLGLPVRTDFIAGGNAAELQGSVHRQASPVGSTQLAYIRNGDWARFNGIDFTGKTELRVHVASQTIGGELEIHLDSLGGPIAATFQVANTGGWDSLKELSAPLTGITGVHNLFAVFKGGDDYLMNLERMILYPLPKFSDQQDGKAIIARGGCSVIGQRDEDAFQQAVDAAKIADAVVMVCGVDSSVSREALDRDDIGLTGPQPDLIKAVYAANPNVVLVLSSNNSVSIEWEQANLPAILGAICGGQAQGTAIAEVLFGDYNPGGKLPMTWYRSINQLPPMHDYDIHKGRTYQYFEDDPLYPFGYGLSYTTFRIDRLQAHSKALRQGETAKYSVRVANTGKRAGAEVVQLYVVPPTAPVKRPLRQLAGFQRVELQPGEEKTVVFELSYLSQAFWYWSDEENRFVCQPGSATIEIGASSANLPLKASLMLQPSSKPLPQKDAVDTTAVKSYIA
jgi:beta-glucosidase